MKKQDPALTFSNPRMLAAIYFGLLSVVGTILINAFLSSIGVEEIISIFRTVLLGIVVAASTGALFGEHIIHCKKPYQIKTFWIGFLMIMASMPVFDLGILLFINEAYRTSFPIDTVSNMVHSYFVILGYSYLLFGFFLGIAAGFAAMYLRGQIVYDILHTHERHQKRRKRNHFIKGMRHIDNP